MDDEPLPTLAELRRRYVEQGHALPSHLEARLRADPRAGAQALLAAVDKRRRAHRAEGQRLRKLLEFEREYWRAGLLLVAGVDEAGMAPLAGPVVAAAVVLDPETRIADVDDSKKLDARTRERLAVEIKQRARGWGVGMATVEEIDRVNIHHAGLLAMRRAVDALGFAPAALLIDARTLRSACCPQRALVHGDARSLSIAAASIVAKTTRDALMTELDARHPGYGFAKHKGYGVPEHLAALARLGVSPVHRRSFAPVRAAMGLAPLHEEAGHDEDRVTPDE